MVPKYSLHLEILLNHLVDGDRAGGVTDERVYSVYSLTSPMYLYLEILVNHLVDGDRAGGVEELVHVHLRVPLRGPVLLL